MAATSCNLIVGERDSLAYWDSVNERQLGVLKRIAAGENLSGDENIPARTSANASFNRRLVAVRRSGGRWDAGITVAGRL